MELAQQQCETVTGIINPRRWTICASIDVGAAPFGKVAHYRLDPVYWDAEQPQKGSIKHGFHQRSNHQPAVGLRQTLARQ
jgi:hypothetical protein